MNNIWLKLIVSISAIALIIAHIGWADLRIDVITFGLIVVALLPWLSTLIESAEFPGGWKIKFRDVQAAGSKITEGAPASSEKQLTPRPAYLELVHLDPNLALVGLRIEIEKRLHALGDKHGIKPQRSLMQCFNELRKLNIFDEKAVTGLEELVKAGTLAAHGAKVEPEVATWALETGPKILGVLDAMLAQPIATSSPNDSLNRSAG